MGYTFQFAWEVSLIEWCQANIPVFIIKILDFVSNIGDVIPVVAIIGFFYLCYDKKFGRRLLINSVVSLVLCGFLKNIFLRRRPYFDNKNIECLKIVDKNYDLYDIKNQGYSFPSMHSSNAATVFGTIYEYYKKNSLLVLAIVMSIIVGSSRFILGCHYPTDVIVGLTVGILCSAFFSKVQDKLSNNQLYILLIVVIAIGFFFCKSSDYYSASGIALGFIGCEIIDNKYINFKNTKNIVRGIVRLLLAGAAFLIVCEGLKFVVPTSFAEANNIGAYLFRTFRYALGIFIGLGLTPMLYKYNLLKIKDDE